MGTEAEKARILLVDADLAIRNLYQYYCNLAFGHDVEFDYCADSHAAELTVNQATEPYVLAVLDNETNGPYLARKIRQHSPKTSIIIVSAWPEEIAVEKKTELVGSGTVDVIAPKMALSQEFEELIRIAVTSRDDYLKNGQASQSEVKKARDFTFRLSERVQKISI